MIVIVVVQPARGTSSSIYDSSGQITTYAATLQKPDRPVSMGPFPAFPWFGCFLKASKSSKSQWCDQPSSWTSKTAQLPCPHNVSYVNWPPHVLHLPARNQRVAVPQFSGGRSVGTPRTLSSFLDLLQALLLILKHKRSIWTTMDLHIINIHFS